METGRDFVKVIHKEIRFTGVLFVKKRIEHTGGLITMPYGESYRRKLALYNFLF